MSLCFRQFAHCVALLALALLLPTRLHAAPQADTFTLSQQTIATGLSRVVAIAAVPHDASRLFVVEQYVLGNGRIRIVDLATNSVRPTPFLTITGVSTGSEQGLLGLCFHPDFANNGYFYVNYVKDAQTWIERYRVSTKDPSIADPTSRKLILAIPRTANNHNCGWMEFGPDGYLYIGVGDGGNAYAVITTPESPLGRLLRIDVNVDDSQPYAIPPTNPWVGATGIDSGWATGLRNPWRCAFDRLTGELWLADVGKNTWEEINVIPAGAAGRNFGWPCFEADVENLVHELCPPVESCTFPIHSYRHTDGRCSIVGGRVYRGPECVTLRGTYFFADVCSHRIYSLSRVADGVPIITDRSAQLPTTMTITTFGEDALGRLYYSGLSGTLVRIVPADIGCTADFNNSGDIDAGDFSWLLAHWGHVGASEIDLDGSGVVDTADLSRLLAQWGTCN